VRVLVEAVRMLVEAVIVLVKAVTGRKSVTRALATRVLSEAKKSQVRPCDCIYFE
jgi:hypothetical protein